MVVFYVHVFLQVLAFPLESEGTVFFSAGPRHDVVYVLFFLYFFFAFFYFFDQVFHIVDLEVEFPEFLVVCFQFFIGDPDIFGYGSDVVSSVFGGSIYKRVEVPFGPFSERVVLESG